jgi:Rrf2 family protein
MLTQKAKYALRALAVLAEANGEGPLPIHTVAERAHAPHKFLEAILLELRRHRLLESTRGKAGGYALAVPPEKIRLGDVIRAIDGPLAPIPCASLTAYRPCADCADPKSCAIRKLMRRVRDATAEILDGASVADLVADPALIGVDDAA